MLLSWLPIALLSLSLWFLIIGVITMDFALQAVHVADQSLIYRVRPEAQNRLTAGYMIFYSIGSAVGSVSPRWSMSRQAGGGVCIMGAVVCAVALVFWALTRD